MADYTPTTENVRSVYAYAGAGQTPERRRAFFDRWLAAHDAEVRASVLAEQGEPEWGVERRGVVIKAGNLAHARSISANDVRYLGWTVVSRRSAGQWLPVEENGETNA